TPSPASSRPLRDRCKRLKAATLSAANEDGGRDERDGSSGFWAWDGDDAGGAGRLQQRWQRRRVRAEVAELRRRRRGHGRFVIVPGCPARLRALGRLALG